MKAKSVKWKIQKYDLLQVKIMFDVDVESTTSACSHQLSILNHVAVFALYLGWENLVLSKQFHYLVRKYPIGSAELLSFNLSLVRFLCALCKQALNRILGSHSKRLGNNLSFLQTPPEHVRAGTRVAQAQPFQPLQACMLLFQTTCVHIRAE